jgi:hypothetical protein
VLCFDQYNIRYISSTVIGEWARDKLIRYCLLTGNGEPFVWDFGSAARHHKLSCPWLQDDHILAGNPGVRGAIGPEVGLFKAAAKEIKAILKKEDGARRRSGLHGKALSAAIRQERLQHVLARRRSNAKHEGEAVSPNAPQAGQQPQGGRGGGRGGAQQLPQQQPPVRPAQ